MLQSVLRHRTLLTFLLCCIAITAVSVHDAVLVVLHEEVISEFEQNPLGCWLIRLQGGEVWLFVWTKLARHSTGGGCISENLPTSFPPGVDRGRPNGRLSADPPSVPVVKVTPVWFPTALPGVDSVLPCSVSSGSYVWHLQFSPPVLYWL